MNHLPPHGRLTAEIRGKAMDLMRKGYHGDGEQLFSPRPSYMLYAEQCLTATCQGFWSVSVRAYMQYMLQRTFAE
jgi:hypothetical protein